MRSEEYFNTIRTLCTRADGASRGDIAIALRRSKDGLSKLMDSATAILGLNRREVRAESGAKLVRWFICAEAADAWQVKHERLPPTRTRRGTFESIPEVVIAGGQFAIAGPRMPLTPTDTPRIPEPIRAGGLDFRQYPSRMGNRLYYRDGRVEEIK